MAVTHSGDVYTVGWKEEGTASSGSTTTLTDTSKSWATDAFKGVTVNIISGTGSGQSRRISSNNADTLTVEEAWDIVPDATSAYKIDHSLNDLYGAGGISKIESGDNSVEDAKRTIFFVGNNAIELSGGLTINPKYEELHFGDSVTTPLIRLRNSTTRLNINGKFNAYGFTRYAKEIAIYMASEAANYWQNTAIKWYNSSAIMNWNGGKIITLNPIYFEGIANIKNGIIEGRDVDYSDFDSPQIRIFSDDVNIDGLLVINMLAVIFSSLATLNHWQQEQAHRALTPYKPTNVITFEDYASNGVEIDFQPYQDNGVAVNQYFIIKNPQNGSATTLKADSSALHRGIGRIESYVEFIVKDNTRNPISNCGVFTEDYDNGKRISNFGFDQDEDFNHATNSSGSTGEQKVLLAIAYRLNDSDPWPFSYDYRNADNDNSDVRNFLFSAYGFLLATVNLNLKGTGTKPFTILLSSDPNITESDRGIVSGYAGIEYDDSSSSIIVSVNHTIEEIYDWIKYYESEHPEKVWFNNKISVISAAGNAYQLLSGWNFIVNSGVTVTADNKILSLSGGGNFTIDGEFTGLINDGSLFRVPIEIKNIIPGSRLYIKKTIDNDVIFNDIITEENKKLYHVISEDTEVLIRLRKSSSQPYYKTWQTIGTVTTASGLSVFADQVED